MEDQKHESTLDTDQFMSEKTRAFMDPVQRSKPQASKNPEIDRASEDLAKRLAADNSTTVKAVESRPAAPEEEVPS